MEFLVAGYEIIDQEPGLEGIYKAAELPGRICYGSQDKMAPGTAEKFCKFSALVENFRKIKNNAKAN